MLNNIHQKGDTHICCSTFATDSNFGVMCIQSDRNSVLLFDISGNEIHFWLELPEKSVQILICTGSTGSPKGISPILLFSGLWEKKIRHLFTLGFRLYSVIWWIAVRRDGLCKAKATPDSRTTWVLHRNAGKGVHPDSSCDCPRHVSKRHQQGMAEGPNIWNCSQET